MRLNASRSVEATIKNRMVVNPQAEQRLVKERAGGCELVHWSFTAKEGIWSTVTYRDKPEIVGDGRVE
jgi:hypothetical protein